MAADAGSPTGIFASGITTETKGEINLLVRAARLVEIHLVLALAAVRTDA